MILTSDRRDIVFHTSPQLLASVVRGLSLGVDYRYPGDFLFVKQCTPDIMWIIRGELQG